jgi:hypothetical protein
MHRRFLGLGFVLAFALGPAQLDAQGITIGLKAGVNVADLAIEEAGTSVSTDTRTVVALGPFVEFGLGGVLAVQPELLYSQKGASFSEPGIDLTFKLNYIEVPVLLKARLSPPGSPVRPSIYAGPVVGFESKCEVEGSAEGVSANIDCSEFVELSEGEVDLQTKSVDFGLALGAGLDIPAGPVVIVGDVRYTLGLTDVNDVTGASALDIKNRAWSVFAGVGIPLGL